MTTKIKVTEYEAEKIVAPDVYEATVKAFSFGEGSFGDYVKIVFTINSGTYEGVDKTLIASKKMQRSSKGPTKLMEIAETLLGRSLEVSEEFDLDSLIGKNCRIVLGEPIKKDGIEYQKVEKVMTSKL